MGDRSLLQGILPVLPTPFRDDMQVDPNALRRLVQFAAASGAGGVVFPGFASEVEFLSAEERSLLLRTAAREAANHVELIAGASGETVEEVVEHCAVADATGARWTMIQAPKHLGDQAEPIAGFLREVADANPDLRIILQNAPAPRGSALKPEVLLKIARSVPQIAYVKEETIPAGPAISNVLSDTRRPAHLLGMIGGGGARYILDEFRRGACAAMPALELADLHVALDAAWRGGRTDDARDIYVQTLPLLTLQSAYRMRLTKYVLVRRGILENALVRVPLPALDCLAVADIEANLEALGLIPVQNAGNECST